MTVFIEGATVVDNEGVEGIIVDIDMDIERPYGVLFDDVDEDLGLWFCDKDDIEVISDEALLEEEIGAKYQWLRARKNKEENIVGEECTTTNDFKMQIKIEEPEPLQIPLEVGQVRQSRDRTKTVLIITNQYRPSLYAKGGEKGVLEEMKALVLLDDEPTHKSMDMKTEVDNASHPINYEYLYPYLLQAELVIKE